MSKKRKRKKSTKINSKNIHSRIAVSCSFLFLLLLSIGIVSYYLFDTNLFSLDISNTANYISFNDIYDSDTIKINNIKQLNDIKGKKYRSTDLDIVGVNEGLEYEIVLVPINVNVEYKYIKYYLTDDKNNELKFGSLDKTSLSNDYSGNVIYNGVLNNKKDKIKLRVWIDSEYDGDIDYNSFEVKTKLK